jgi:hypothetical protein
VRAEEPALPIGGRDQCRRVIFRPGVQLAAAGEFPLRRCPKLVRVRGEAHGPDGITDLCRALTLVGGQSFDQLRAGGWSWLHEGDRLDQRMLCAIVDAPTWSPPPHSRTATSDTARAAAEVAALSAPQEEIPRLDLAAVAATEGHAREAERILREGLWTAPTTGKRPWNCPNALRESSAATTG